MSLITCQRPPVRVTEPTVSKNHFLICLSFLSSPSLLQCLFRTSPWGRLSGVPPFRTSSCSTASRCPSLCRRLSTHASSRRLSTSSRPTGLNPASLTSQNVFWECSKSVYDDVDFFKKHDDTTIGVPLFYSIRKPTTGRFDCSPVSGPSVALTFHTFVRFHSPQCGNN